MNKDKPEKVWKIKRYVIEVFESTGRNKKEALENIKNSHGCNEVHLIKETAKVVKGVTV